MKRTTLVTLALAGLLTFGACDTVESDGDSNYAPADPGGVGMTYGGKQGIDLGGGMIMPFDGSGIQPGFGY